MLRSWKQIPSDSTKKIGVVRFTFNSTRDHSKKIGCFNARIEGRCRRHVKLGGKLLFHLMENGFQIKTRLDSVVRK